MNKDNTLPSCNSLPRPPTSSQLLLITEGSSIRSMSWMLIFYKINGRKNPELVTQTSSSLISATDNGLYLPFLTVGNRSTLQRVGLNVTSGHTSLCCVGSNCREAEKLFTDGILCFNVFISYS